MLGIGNLLTPTRTAAPATSYSASEPLARPSTPSASKVLRWAVVPLALLLGVIYLVYQHGRQPNMGGTSEDTWVTHGAGTPITAPQIDTAQWTERLKAAIASSDGNPIDLQGVTFDNMGNLSATARSSLSQLGNLVNENPSMQVTVTAYGATAEEAAGRANAIKSALVSAGVAEDRIAVQPEIGQAIPRVRFTK
jgi:hypothetical protein